MAAQEDAELALRAVRTRHVELQAKPRPRRLDFSGTDVARAVGFADPDYPQRLRHIPDPPLVLFVAGEREVLERPALAVVGARQCTRQGAELAGQLGGDLASAGLVVVSGLARGIDAAAHRGCLDAGGQTLAVLGSGLDHIYPRANHELCERIIATGGTVVSEYGDDQGPRRHHFPERNRIISALAAGVVVVEATDKSGSLITARLALEQGRDVMAFPGPVHSLVSSGCHRLIQQGAYLVTGANDVFEALAMEHTLSAQADAAEQTANLSPEAGDVLAQLSGYPVDVDELVAALHMGSDAVLRALVELELEGIVSRVPLGYIRALAK